MTLLTTIRCLDSACPVRNDLQDVCVGEALMLSTLSPNIQAHALSSYALLKQIQAREIGLTNIPYRPSNMPFHQMVHSAVCVEFTLKVIEAM